MKKLAVIGYGGMGGWHCASIKAQIPELTVKGVFDIRTERVEAAKQDGYYVYDSVDAILADPEIDMVTIATPNDSHKPIAIAAMRAGKHVITEKPATMCAADYEEMMAVAKECGVLLTTHQNRRWDTDFNMVKRIYEERPIGDVYMLESRVQGSRQVLHGWRGAKINGGGMVYDWGVHLLDQLMWMIKSPVISVNADLFYIFTDEVDDNFKATLRFENGISALVEVSMNCFILHPRWHVSANEGTAVINDWECNGKMVVLNEDSEMAWEEKIVYTAAGPTRSMAPRPVETTKEIPLPKVDMHWSDYYRNVIAAIDGKEELIVKPEQILRVLKVLDAIFESGRTHKSVSCRI